MAKLWSQTWCVLVVASLLGLVGYSTPEGEGGGPSVSGEGGTELVARSDWKPFFEAEGISGATFVLHEIGTDRTEVYDESRAREPMSPASTFKIMNSMIILETGVLPDVDAVVPWDGVDRELDEWNRDHSLRSGIEVSAVWLYQELAQKVGEDKMQQWVTEAAYGNENIGGPIDSFWLDGDLRISALEQVEFLTRLESGELPFRTETVDAVREILVQESRTDWSWSYKTGLSATADPDLGWLVGTVDNGTSTWVFALNVDLEQAGSQLDPSVRQTVAREILEAKAVLPLS